MSQPRTGRLVYVRFWGTRRARIQWLNREKITLREGLIDLEGG